MNIAASTHNDSIAIKIISYLFVASDLSIKITLNVSIFKNISNKASQLYEAMAEIRNLQAQQGHQGRHISEVGPHQQHCHIMELQ